MGERDCLNCDSRDWDDGQDWVGDGSWGRNPDFSGTPSSLQVLGWDGGFQEGADAVKEGFGAVAGFTGVGFVELPFGVVV